MVVGVDIHKIDCIPHQVKQEDQYVMVINNVVPEGQAQTGKAVVDIGHNTRGIPPYHGPYNVQPVGVLRHTNYYVIP
jgi:hypothetical protein